MRIHLSLSFTKPLLVLAVLMICMSSRANDVELSTNAPQVVDSSLASSAMPSVNSQEAKKAFMKANAMLVEMALRFRNSKSSPSDYADVVKNYCLAAKLGDAGAQYALGWLYANGRGVTVDEKIAAQLFTMAAEQGHAQAQEYLGRNPSASTETPSLACLLPELPITVASQTVMKTNQYGQNAISNKTEALFYSHDHILKLVNRLSPHYGIDSNLVMAFIAVESGFNVQATSPKNAQGLMQLIPETAARFGVKDPYKAEDNIKGGLAYLQWLLAYFKGDVQLVAAAYNAGEGAVVKYKGVPPYAETETYVKNIASFYNISSHPYRTDLVKASPILELVKKKSF